ncbi:histidinol-phosphate transaminase [Demequina sp. TTPB684]|uniref:histidinol-phosphate transaminase n=1 Tax=unclassified Demequina TaxID=2620311 RepID=UPI001CF2A5C1|nr:MULTISPECIES: histidinol-phosphate transaminase [unclassified Demequina]MCB2413434.1 histidinol-phosphate transaminase [Demequina sp. TTPB684]UPU87997.1 histidinol-phosphate transaminase [Demequina sp. TMPB413]
MVLPEPLPNVSSLPRYVPGARGSASGPAPIKLSSNENALAPLPSVAQAIATAGGSVNRYPDMFAGELVNALAERQGVAPENVIVGAGSVAVLAHLLQAYAGPGREVVYAWRSFEAYPILTALTGATPVTAPLAPDGRHDLDAMAALITDDTAAVMVCSPNNPTGPAVTADEFAAFVDKVPPSVLVVLDEAYVEFVTDASAVDGNRYIGDDAWKAHPNVVVLRTMSKAYGLAGLRVGFAFGLSDVLAPVRACVTPFSVSSVAQTAALASLAAQDELLARVEGIVAERERVVAALAADGWSVPDAQGNFVWIGARERTGELVAHLGSQSPAILVRPFADEGVRITIGDPEENDAVIAGLAGLGWRV